MKKLFIILCAVVFWVASCDRYGEIWDELREHEQRIEQLEKQCRELNSNVEAIQTILTAIQQNDYVTEIMKIVEDGVEVGYSITFAKSGTVTIYHGTNGEDGSTPKVGIKKASDGQYYWTSDGEWLTGEDGEKIPAAYSDGGDGEYITPLFRVAEGVWYVSYDNGNTWQQIEAEEECESIFKGVDASDPEYVVVILADGSQLKLPKWKESMSYWAGKKLIWNGDSISYGSWLESPETEAYPYQVGRALGMETYNFAIGGSYAAKPKGSFDEFYWDYAKWQADVAAGLVDTSKKYLVKDYANKKKPCRIYYHNGTKWTTNSETGGWAIVERMKEMVALHPDADVIGIAIGTNDFITSACPFGDVDAANYRNLAKLREEFAASNTKNLLKEDGVELYEKTKLLKPSFELASDDLYYVYMYIPIKPGKNYKARSSARSWFLDADKNPLSTVNLNQQNSQFTAPENAAYICVTFSYSGVKNPQDASLICLDDDFDEDAFQKVVDDLTKSTFCGAIHTICKYLLENYPNKDIVFVTPIKRRQGSIQYPEDKNSLGYTLLDYTDAIIEICGYYSIPVIDFYRNSGLNPHIDDSLFADTDGKVVHPNLEGHKRMASLVIAYLEGLRK